MRNVREFVRVVWVAAALVAGGCNDSHTVSAGSESHFLERCIDDASCGVLDCIANVCTRECTSDAVCGELSGASACMQVSSGDAMTCEVACERDGDCGDGLACLSGVCRPRAGARPMMSESGGRVDAGAASGSVMAGRGAVAPPAAGRGDDGSLIGDAVDSVHHCGLVTPFPGDEYCLEPPAPELGMQIHIGPRSYDDPREIERWKLEPGSEISECWSFTSNDVKTFSRWEASGRPGLHHVAVAFEPAMSPDQCASAFDPEAEAVPGVVVVFPPRAEGTLSPPISVTVGSHAGAHLHTFNFTELPMLREVWINLYY